MRIFFLNLVTLLIPFSASAQSIGDNADDKIKNTYNFKTGIYIPYSKAEVLGIHPTVGFDYGFIFQKSRVFFSFDYKLFDSKKFYDFRLGDSIITTNNFSGNFYFGIDYNRIFFKNNFNQIGFILGIGFEEFEAYKPDDYWDRLFSSKGMVITYNFNFGFNYKRSLNTNFSIGIYAKYNIVDYTINDKTTLKGNYLTSGLILIFDE